MYSIGFVARTVSLLRRSQGTPFSFPTNVISSEHFSNLQNGLFPFLQYLYDSWSYKVEYQHISWQFKFSTIIILFFLKRRLNFIFFHNRITRLQFFFG